MPEEPKTDEQTPIIPIDIDDDHKDKKNKFSKRMITRRNYIIASGILLLGLIAAGIVIFFSPISNYLVLKNASPAMVTLAEQAGMSKKGELTFLKADPQFASDSQMSTDCAGNAAANNKNGFIEQGCYVPSKNNSAIGRIYIRQMPANLYDQEIVTAAYEMLHSVYFSNNSSKLVMSIESNYSNISSARLNSLVVNFAKTEPGYRDLELFSLLGTEYTNLTPKLTAYYNPYFSNRDLTVNSYNQVSAIFKNNKTQLNKLSQTVTSDNSLANSAYADSIAWAKAGNAYEDSYDYNIYKNYIADENATITKYNQLSQAYNTLVTEYNGTQPVSTIQSVTTQNSK